MCTRVTGGGWHSAPGGGRGGTFKRVSFFPRLSAFVTLRFLPARRLRSLLGHLCLLGSLSSALGTSCSFQRIGWVRPGAQAAAAPWGLVTAGAQHPLCSSELFLGLGPCVQPVRPGSPPDPTAHRTEGRHCGCGGASFTLLVALQLRGPSMGWAVARASLKRTRRRWEPLALGDFVGISGSSAWQAILRSRLRPLAERGSPTTRFPTGGGGVE